MTTSLLIREDTVREALREVIDPELGESLVDVSVLVDTSAPSPISDDIRVDTPIAEDLDVRSLLANGEEPFSVIMASAARVPAHAAIRLRTTFEPVPLYDVLGGRGFAHEAHQLGPDDWEIVFRRGDGTASNSSNTGPSAQTATDVASTSPTRTEADLVRLDVSDLAPPEPMVRILEAAAKLGPEQTLFVAHHRRPVYLDPQLDLPFRFMATALGWLGVLAVVYPWHTPLLLGSFYDSHLLMFVHVNTLGVRSCSAPSACTSASSWLPFSERRIGTWCSGTC